MKFDIEIKTLQYMVQISFVMNWEVELNQFILVSCFTIKQFDLKVYNKFCLHIFNYLPFVVEEFFPDNF